MGTFTNVTVYENAITLSGSGVVPVTIDPDNYSSSELILSPDKLTVTANGIPGSDGPFAFGTVVCSGKKFWEVGLDFVTGAASNHFYDVGICISPITITDFIDGPGVALFFQGDTSWELWNNGQQAAGSISGGNHTVGVAYDEPNNKVYFAIDGTWIVGDPVAGTGGITPVHAGPFFPAIDIEGGGGVDVGAACTYNFGASSFVGTVPTGYNTF